MFSVDYKILLWSFSTVLILSSQSTESANISCGLPPPVPNSVTRYSSINFGSTVTYVCHKGYILYGTSQRTCRADGKWDGESPDCRRRTCGYSSMDFRRRIVGGVESRRGAWPWQIAIYFTGNGSVRTFICGGALVSRQWVLTAAHCVDRNASSYLIKAGKHNLARNETLQQEIEPEKIFVHHEYRLDNNFDIALVKLKREVKINSFVRPVCLPKKEEGDQAIPMTNGVVSGWGITRALRNTEDYSLNEISEVLRHAVFTIQSNQLCSSKALITYNSTVQFCAGDGKGKKDSCVGDSGGAFVREISRGTNVHWVAVGIVGWGWGCAQKDEYGYYIRVYPFIDWIEKTMEDRPVHGGYSQWSSWSPCSQSCAGGIQRRYRFCINPRPENGGRDCSKLRGAIESKICNAQSCPVHGGYSQWSIWFRCSRSCAGGIQRRYRYCINPRPENGGRDCYGLGRALEWKICNRQSCPVHGGYSQWSSWSGCSRTCSWGTRQRSRTCTNPKPKNGGRHCSGGAKESKSCYTQSCPVHGGYSWWSSWSSCSKTCGGGTQERSRTCNNPKPKNGGRGCSGNAKGKQSCNNQDCPCFPANSHVMLKSGANISMRQLCVGDTVRTLGMNGETSESKVIAFLHKETKTKAKFYKIESSGGRAVIISPGHLIFRKENSTSPISAVFASEIKLGNLLYTSNGSVSEYKAVTRISMTTEMGIYAPLTMQGTLLVDGILVSCYATWPSHDTAHFAMAPLRVAYTITGGWNLIDWAFWNDYQETEGISWYASALIALKNIIL